MSRFFLRFGRIGAVAGDAPELMLQKQFLVYLGGAMSLGGIMWGSLALWQGLLFAAVIPYGYTVVTFFNFLGFQLRKNFRIAKFVQIVISLLLPFMFQYSLGGFANTGSVMLWALISLVAAFTFENLQNMLFWLFLYVALTVALGVLDAQTPRTLVVAEDIKTFFFVLNIVVISTIVAGLSYYFLRNRSQVLIELDLAKRETDLVLSAVDEGLFLIRRSAASYRIGEQQSPGVLQILGLSAALPAVDFLVAMAPFLSPAKQQEAENYLTLLNSATIKPKMVAALNPLELVNISVGYPPVEKYIQFRFTPVEQGKQDQYLVRIKDMTQETILAQQIEASEKRNQESTQMILSVLHIGPKLLADFLEGVDAELSTIEEILQSDKPAAQVMQRIEELYRAIHSIKGNASLLDLQLLVNASHDFEDKVEKIRERNAATWDDFIPLALDVAKLQDTISGLKDLLRRLQTFRHEGGQVHESAIATIPENIRTMVERIAAEHGKEIDVSFTEFSADRVPARFAYILRDIGVQLARNAVVHGFETPENRRKAGKHDRGSLTLSLSQVGEDVLFTVRDDGRSFDLDAIRRKAAARQGLEPEAITAWDNKKLINQIFEPGFSTAATTTTAAGRGMGLDIVKQRVKKAGGEVRINFAAGQFTEFLITLPLAEQP